MRNHTTHHDDCGCLSARYEARLDAQRAATASLEALNRKHAEMYAKEIDRHEAQIASLKHDEATLLEDADYMRQRIAALEAERGEWRAAAGREIAVAYAHANALRDALEGIVPVLEKNDMPQSAHVLRNILAAHPAASLAAHDAEVLERASAMLAQLVSRGNAGNIGAFGDGLIQGHKNALEVLRALAAQAQEVKP